MNKAKDKNILEEYPSLNLAYEQVKDVLIQQKKTIRDYRSSAVAFFIIATAIVGLGIPIGFIKELKEVILFPSFTLFDIAIIPILLYIAIALVAWRVYSFSTVKTMNNPTIILQYFSHLEQAKFIYEILLHTEEAFRYNKAIVEDKQRYLRALPILIAIETIIVVLWIWTAFGFIAF